MAQGDSGVTVDSDAIGSEGWVHRYAVVNGVRLHYVE